MWNKNCVICLNEELIQLINQCRCKDLVCQKCTERINKCQFCRQDYNRTVGASGTDRHSGDYWFELERQAYHRAAGTPGAASHPLNYWLELNSSDDEDQHPYGHFITQPIVSGVGLTLDERDAKTAQDNWDHWFHQLNSYMVMTLNKQETPLHTRAVIHQQLQTGNFDDWREAGVCVNELAA